MKNTLLILFCLCTVINAQGITNTLGGSTANDMFIVENNKLEEVLVITGEGNVGIGTDNPNYDLDIIKQNGESYTRIRSNNASSSLIIDKFYPADMGQIVYQQGHQSKFFTGLLGNNNYRISTDRFSLNGLEVQENGQIKISGGNPGEGKILTSDANGLASWQGPKTEYLSIPSAAFLTSSGMLKRSGPHIIGTEDGYNYECFYPLILPHGAKITSLNINSMDGDSDENVTLTLYGWDTGTGSFVIMAEVISGSTSTNHTTNIVNPIIDNSSSVYWLESKWHGKSAYLDYVKMTYEH